MTTKVNERALVLEMLLAVNEEGQYSHLVLRDVLDKYQYLGKQERAFLTRLMEGTLAPVACLDSGGTPCERASECRTLSLWAGLNDVINNYLDQYTLASLLREDGGFDYVI